LLDCIHNIPLKSGIESLFIKKAVAFYQKKQQQTGEKPQLLRQESYAKKAIKHYAVPSLSYRKLSLHQEQISCFYSNDT
jgi:hypothetical protein